MPCTSPAASPASISGQVATTHPLVLSAGPLLRQDWIDGWLATGAGIWDRQLPGKAPDGCLGRLSPTSQRDDSGQPGPEVNLLGTA
ncbi:MAG: hypothetical protein L0K86_25250, partial [Actinomycetia bacterium]|nr:hypothetical protein [Actinomycetes bacterium]